MNDFASDLLLLTAAEMALADRASAALGVSGRTLMEAAGRAVADVVQARWPGLPVVVLCGPGNNGGDGFVAARHLHAAGRSVRLALLGATSELKGDAAHHAALWKGPVEPFSTHLLDADGVVVDAIFGAGLSRPVEGVAREMIEALAARRLPVCAIDVPSGLDGSTGAVQGAAAKATVTVTFFRKKPAHLLFPGRTLCGEVVLADIGMPVQALEGIGAQAYENGPALWGAAYPWPQADGHKHQRGNVLIRGGAEVIGASRLAARAAMRVGAGLVTLAAPAAAWSIYASSMSGVYVRPVSAEEDFNSLLSDPRRNVIAIGLGAGVDDGTRKAVLAALATQRAVVLDGDALTTFAPDPDLLFRSVLGPCVLTPHESEFERLFDVVGDKLTRARHAAATSGAVVLLKGGDTVIAEPGGRAIVNSNAPPDLATGGSGDVLTGFIAGLLAQGLDAFHAAAAGAWLHGEVAAAFGPGLVAEDLHECLPAVLRRLKGDPGAMREMRASTR